MEFILATPAEILHTLGARLRSQRLAQNLTQAELAGMAGLSLGAVRKLQALFELPRQSIAQMEQAAAAQQRQRARRTERSNSHA